jgi:type I site-specific restriction-modification system R (restriction) subunit
MNISGAMGYVVLKNPKKDNYVILFSDIHDGVKYCDENSKFIDDFLKESMNKYSILLEEVPRLGVQLIELWAGSKHTQKLKQLYLNESHQIEGIDLRPYLVPFSYQKHYYGKGLEEKEKNLLMKEYLNLLEILFNPDEMKLLIDKLPYPQFFKKILELLEKLPSQSGVINYFKRLRDKFNEMKKEIDLEKTVEKVLNENRNWFERLDDLKSEIMDWYTILLISSLDNNIIVHFGLAHFVNTLEELEKIGFKVVKRNGLTSFYGNKEKACTKFY